MTRPSSDLEDLFVTPSPAEIKEREKRKQVALRRLDELHRQLANCYPNFSNPEQKARRTLTLAAKVGLLWKDLRPEFSPVINAAERAQGVMQIILKACQSDGDWECFGPGSIGPRTLLSEAIDDLREAIAKFREQNNA